MDFFKQYLGEALAGLISAMVAWYFSKSKERADLQQSELEQVDKSLRIYREMVENLGEQLRNAITELNAAKSKIEELELIIEELTRELKKYKQLNGKSK